MGGYLVRLNLDYIEDYTQRVEIEFKRFLYKKSFHNLMTKHIVNKQNRR